MCISAGARARVRHAALSRPSPPPPHTHTPPARAGYANDYYSAVAITDMSMVPLPGGYPGRTYKYFDTAGTSLSAPLFPFGAGLSYTTFTLAGGCPSPPAWRAEGGSAGAAQAPVNCSITVTNTGARDGDEVVQVFSSARAGSVRAARAAAAAACGAALPPAPDVLAKKQLVGFQRVAVPAGRAVAVNFSIPFAALASVDAAGDRVVWPGDYALAFETGGEGAPRVEVPLRVAVEGGAGQGCDGVWARRFPKLGGAAAAAAR